VPDIRISQLLDITMPAHYIAASKRSYKFGPSEVVAAVESLYEDKVQPLGRLLLKRVGERATASNGVDQATVPRIDPKYLRHVCERCNQLVLEQMDSGEYSVFLVGRPANFVDANSESDPYPAKLWEELRAYFEGLEGDRIFWPSGRFACAQALATRGPSCLAYRSLGELVHIVQLCVGPKKTLGYRNGHLVPYRYSELMEKEQYATCKQPVVPTKKGAFNSISLPVASWEDARTGLSWLLTCASQGAIQLPNVKRLFRSDLGVELSETALGYSRIFELLHDPRMSSVCDLRLEGKNWMVLRKSLCSASESSASSLAAPDGFEFHFGEVDFMDCESGAQRPLEAGARVPEGASSFRCLSTAPVVGLVAPGFAVPLPFVAMAPEPSDAVCKNVDEKFETASYASTWDPMEDYLEDPLGDPDATCCSNSAYPWHRNFPSEAPTETGSCCPDSEQPSEEMDFNIVKNTFIHFSDSSKANVRSSSVPRGMRLKLCR
jgi:hypothetical protein